MANTKVKSSILIWAVSLLSLYSCGLKGKSDKKIFYYNEQTGIASLDPAFAKNQSIMWAVHQLYNTLVEIDDSLHIIPSVASSWELSPDRLTYTFHLRNDIYFHDDPVFPSGKGRKLVASDVFYSLSRIMDKNTSSPGSLIFNRKIDTLHPFHAINYSIF